VASDEQAMANTSRGPSAPAKGGANRKWCPLSLFHKGHPSFVKISGHSHGLRKVALMTSIKCKSRQEGGLHSLARNCPADVPAEALVYRIVNDKSRENRDSKRGLLTLRAGAMTSGNELDILASMPEHKLSELAQLLLALDDGQEVIPQ